MATARLTRAERQAQTRARILDSAAAVFAEKGFSGASVEEIAERAGYTRGAFYSNFESKDDAFLALVDQRFEKGVSEISEIIETSKSRAEVMTRLKDRSERQPFEESWSLVFAEFQLYAIRNPSVRTKLAERNRAERKALARAVEFQFARAGAEPPASLELMSLIMYVLDIGCTMEHLIDPERIDRHAYNDAVSLLFEAAIALSESRRKPRGRASAP